MSLQDKMNSYWDHRAEHYHAAHLHGGRAAQEHRIWVDLLSRQLQGRRLNVLDIGAGTGYISRILADLGHRVTAVDSSAGMLAQAQAADEGRGITYLVGDAAAPPVDGQRFDLVISRYVLWTLLDLDEALRAWKSVLEPEGFVLALDAHHFPEGMGAIDKVDSDAGEDSFLKTYNEDMAAHLSLAQAGDTQAYVAAFHRAGFDEVSVENITAFAELNARFELPAGHAPVIPFALRAQVSSSRL